MFKTTRTYSFLISGILLLALFFIYGCGSVTGGGGGGGGGAATWQVVGNADFTADQATYISLFISSEGTPYIAFKDGVYGGKATVMKYDGANWVNVGNAGFSSGAAQEKSLFMYGGIPYVAYSDEGLTYKMSVMKLNGLTWESVGNPSFSSGEATFTSLFISSEGTPYVAYKDGGNSSKATVMKCNVGSNTWEVVGSAGFSASTAQYTSLFINSSGIPYVAYSDVDNNYQATVMKFSP